MCLYIYFSQLTKPLLLALDQETAPKAICRFNDKKETFTKRIFATNQTFTSDIGIGNRIKAIHKFFKKRLNSETNYHQEIV